MALKHLDLEEQEQLDSLKAFWKQWGNLISGVLIVVFGSIAGYRGWQLYQGNQAAQAAAMYDEVERATASGDTAKITRAFSDMKDKFGGTTYAAQAGLLAAKALYEKGGDKAAELAKAPLEWVSGNASDDSYKAVAKLRLAGLQIEAKKYDEALKLTEGLPKAYEALGQDRRGDVLLAQGKREDAKAAFEKAYKGLEERAEYRRIVEVKLNSLGVDVSDKTKTAKTEPVASAPAAPAAPASPATQAPSAASTPATAASAQK
jgi:predicted negative regulator of RcsB-dependent stress response